MFPQLTRAQQERVVDAVVKFASEPEVVLMKESPRYMTALG
jgi:hypothetical protein